MALKVAYAEMILNTAKEAAARVMVSEKRAALFQHELNCSKEESLRLLLRLKQMIDAKVHSIFFPFEFSLSLSLKLLKLI